MSEITRVGADLAKRVLLVHALDAAGKLVTNKALAHDKFLPLVRTIDAGLHGGHGSQLKRLPLGP